MDGPLMGAPDFAPLLAAVAALVAVRFVAGIRLRPAVALAAACVGVLWLPLAAAWGAPLAAIAALLACLALAPHGKRLSREVT